MILDDDNMCTRNLSHAKLYLRLYLAPFQDIAFDMSNIAIFGYTLWILSRLISRTPGWTVYLSLIGFVLVFSSRLSAVD